MRPNLKPFSPLDSSRRSSKLDPMLIGFNELFSHEKNGRINQPGSTFFSFPKEACPCLSRNHNRASRESKTVTLVKGKNKKRVFFRFRGCASRESKTVTLAKEKKQKTRIFFLS